MSILGNLCLVLDREDFLLRGGIVFLLLFGWSRVDIVKKMFCFWSFGKREHIFPGKFLSGMQLVVRIKCYAMLCPVYIGGSKNS